MLLCWTLVMGAGCGGGSDPAANNAAGGASSTPSVEMPASRADAARFLTQATFGPTDAEIDRVMAIGYAAWIDEQFALPAASHLASWDAANAAMKAVSATDAASQEQVLESFWKQALTGPDQLRQRMAYALSQIFVVSMADGVVANDPRATASWLDLLGSRSFGSYRELLESATLHPLMGVYLSYLKNRKADPSTGRVPDENYAREVMQLFSIGLVELNEDGSARGGGIDTYGQADVGGLARVFTGWSWTCPEWPSDSCFTSDPSNAGGDPDRTVKPMVAYADFHSTEAKTFLGTTIAAQSTADANASLKTALDTLSAHPNVGPFIGRQLIQRLVTSNPSPTYIRAVSQAFADNGVGNRGDLKAVLKAILMNPEARRMSDGAGKLREPVLKLSAFLRAFAHHSDTGNYRVGNTDSSALELGQTPLRSPSVFNFYRPGYVPPGTAAAEASLVVPEMQIANETSVAGYVNYMRDNLAGGVGHFNNGFNRRDLQGDYSAELALAETPAELVEYVAFKLTYGSAPKALKTEIIDAISKITLPALESGGGNQAVIDNARRLRVCVAVLLVLASPEFQVQK
jgi:uncharacterized protein (DUF1800 family)